MSSKNQKVFTLKVDILIKHKENIFIVLIFLDNGRVEQQQVVSFDAFLIVTLIIIFFAFTLATFTLIINFLSGKTISLSITPLTTTTTTTTTTKTPTTFSTTSILKIKATEATLPVSSKQMIVTTGLGNLLFFFNQKVFIKKKLLNELTVVYSESEINEIRIAANFLF